MLRKEDSRNNLKIWMFSLLRKWTLDQLPLGSVNNINRILLINKYVEFLKVILYYNTDVIREQFWKQHSFLGSKPAEFIELTDIIPCNS